MEPDSQPKIYYSISLVKLAVEFTNGAKKIVIIKISNN